MHPVSTQPWGLMFFASVSTNSCGLWAAASAPNAGWGQISQHHPVFQGLAASPGACVGPQQAGPAVLLVQKGTPSDVRSLCVLKPYDKIDLEKLSHFMKDLDHVEIIMAMEMNLDLKFLI